MVIKIYVVDLRKSMKYLPFQCTNYHGRNYSAQPVK